MEGEENFPIIHKLINEKFPNHLNLNIKHYQNPSSRYIRNQLRKRGINQPTEEILNQAPKENEYVITFEEIIEDNIINQRTVIIITDINEDIIEVASSK